MTMKDALTILPAVAFSPDRRTLAAAEPISRSFASGIWRRAEPLFMLAGRTGIVHSMAFSPDGRSLASARAWITRS